MKAFVYTSFVVGLTNALTMEYRNLDPLRTFNGTLDDDRAKISYSNMLQITFISTLSCFSVLWILYFLLGLGKSFVAHEKLESFENIQNPNIQSQNISENLESLGGSV